MYGDTEEEMDGTQLSAEWAFSSLQMFGQEFLKKLRGKKLPNKLLEKVIRSVLKLSLLTAVPVHALLPSHCSGVDLTSPVAC